MDFIKRRDIKINEMIEHYTRPPPAQLREMDNTNIQVCGIPNAEISRESLSKLFWDLENVLSDETRHSLDHKFLLIYLKEDIVVRGLRFHIMSPFPKRVESVSTPALYCLMERFSHKRQYLATVLSERINTMNENSDKFKNHPDFLRMSRVLCSQSMDIERNILEVKSKKLKSKSNNNVGIASPSTPTNNQNPNAYRYGTSRSLRKKKPFSKMSINRQIWFLKPNVIKHFQHDRFPLTIDVK